MDPRSILEQILLHAAKCLSLCAVCYTFVAATVSGAVIQCSLQHMSSFLLKCRRFLWPVGHECYDNLALEQDSPHAWGCLHSSLGCWHQLCNCCCHPSGQMVRRSVVGSSQESRLQAHAANGYEVFLLAIALLKTSLLMNHASNQQMHA